MAESPLTLPELITINDRNLADVDIPDFLNSSPFMRTNAATVASHDTIHKYLLYQNPTVGFRTVNDGNEVQSSTDESSFLACQIINASFRIDKDLAESFRKGGAAGMINREASRHLDAAFFKNEMQVFNGRATAAAGGGDVEQFTGPGTGQGDAAGFNGLPNFTPCGALAGAMVVNAAGTDNRTSVWLVRSGMFDCEIVTGRSGNISIGATNIQETAGSTTGTYPAYYTPVSAWYALKPGSNVTSVARICNVDVTGATGTALSDDLIYSAMKLFGAGRQPTHIYMSRGAQEALRASRTATNGTGSPAPRPTDVEGVPVIPTDGITDVEIAVV